MSARGGIEALGLCDSSDAGVDLGVELRGPEGVKGSDAEARVSLGVLGDIRCCRPAGLGERQGSKGSG